MSKNISFVLFLRIDVSNEVHCYNQADVPI